MTDLVYEKGTVLVAPGGGGAFTPLLPGADGQALIYDSTSDLGVRPGAGGTGNVTGPGSSTNGSLVAFDGTDGDLLEDSGILAADVAIGAASSTLGNLASFAGTDGKILADSGRSAANAVLNAGASTANALVRFSGTGGKTVKDSDTTLSDTDVMTFPADGGVVLTAGARKGTFTFNGSGTHAKILTAAAVTGCVIATTVVTVSGASEAQAIECVIDNGVGFTPNSADSSDASIVNWAIVA